MDQKLLLGEQYLIKYKKLVVILMELNVEVFQKQILTQLSTKNSKKQVFISANP
jgi:hypothetical protein